MIFIRKLILILLFSSLLLNTTAYEDKESIRKRVSFYKQIENYSNDLISATVDKEKGLYCKAKTFVSNNQKTLEVPMNQAICPHFLFPFKFEIVEMLNNIKNLTNTVGKEQKLSVFVLVYNILYQLYANKKFVKDYIKEKELVQYENLKIQEINNIEDSFPKIILRKSTLEYDHYRLLSMKKLANEAPDELVFIYKSVLYQVTQNDHMEAIFHWISSFDNFKHAYGIVMSRAMTLRLNEYYVLLDLKNNQFKYNEIERKNLDINQYMCKNVGCPCIILFIDLCNHYQPQFTDLRDKRPIVLDTIVGYFQNSATKNYDMGEEINFTYTNDPNNKVLFMNYGFTIPNNIFNLYKLQVMDEVTLNQFQLKLCGELHCFDNASASDTSVIPSIRQYTFKYNSFNENLINYAKVKSLKNKDLEKSSYSSLLKSIKSNAIISDNHEIASWVYYLQILRGDFISSSKASLKDSIKNGQIYRDKRRALEKEWRDEEYQRKSWRDLRHYDLIYDMDISYKRIVLVNILHSENKLIKTIHSDIIGNMKKSILSSIK